MEAFREETRTWLQQNAPASLCGRANDRTAEFWGGAKSKISDPDVKIWFERCRDRGFIAPSWPREYGGGGYSRPEAQIIEEEIRRSRLPPPLIGFGLSMIGPTLLEFGTEEQKREHLPKIARGEIRWCQGYSEPNAGSDLASLQCAALRDGDEFVINGQKTWTSYGDLSDWMFLLVRTDPKAKKQQGITFILLDLSNPGVTIKPIRLISGASPFCESFFENVRVPARNVVGGINQGWTVAKALLSHERTMIANVFGTGQRGGKRGDAVLDIARRYLGDEKGHITDSRIRDRLVQLALDEACFELTVQRTSDNAKAGHKPGPEASLFKIYGTELNQRRQDLLCSILGPQCLGWEVDGFDAEAVDLTRQWLRSRGNTIEGGTSEIQLNIIAKRVLGLPD